MNNNKAIITKIEKARTEGYRPVVVACIYNDDEILFLFQRKYQLWQLPQGGVEPGENILEALKREVREELGEFAESLDISKAAFIGEDKVEFPKENQGSREVSDQSGKRYFMKGKKYFFILVPAKNKTLDIDNTEFEKYRWTKLEETENLTTQIYQKGKRRVTQKAIELIQMKIK